jgi:hypothetical protein
MYANGFPPLDLAPAAQQQWLMRLSVQAGIIDRGQARQLGLSDRQIWHRLRTERWQQVHTGVYATFSGPLSREARLWAAIRWAGRDAMLGRETAAEIQGITDGPPGSGIHIVVPLRRRPGQLSPAQGIVLHRADRIQDHLAGPFTPPRTRIEDTVLDLVAAAPTFGSAYGWVSRAVSRKLVTVAALQTALASRSRIRWRPWLSDGLDDAGDGAHSSLERRYVADVERAHGLPGSQHQARRLLDGKTHFRDCWYPEFGVAVEIDGPSYHQDERVQLDRDRDNVNLALDDVKTFRFGPVAVTERACETAALVAATLRRNGWSGTTRPCRRAGCALRASEVHALAT